MEERVITITYKRTVTKASQEAARSNGRNGGRPPGHPLSEEHKAKLRAAQATRRARERLEKGRQGILVLETQLKQEMSETVVAMPKRPVVDAKCA